ncbi:MAG: C40 family peptidase [Bifidobacteriaceae bacterium]|nr:C40 family peptidase [Bifidobacteriaceae bacterium]
MMKFKKSMYSIATLLALISTVMISPTALASAGSAQVVTSVRSFAKIKSNRANTSDESASTKVENNSNWGGIESLNVPQTPSAAEIEAASRAAERESLSNRTSSSTSNSASVTVTPPNDASVASLLDVISQVVGKVPYKYGGNTLAGWDCSGFVQYVYNQVGVSLPHNSGGQARAGVAVESLAQAQPGDIIANGSHASIYVGNGMVAHASSPSTGTLYSSVSYSFASGNYSIRRIL